MAGGEITNLPNRRNCPSEENFNLLSRGILTYKVKVLRGEYLLDLALEFGAEALVGCSCGSLRDNSPLPRESPN